MPNADENEDAAAEGDNRVAAEDEQEEVDFGTFLPAPTSAIAKEIHKVIMTEQRINTTQLFTFLSDADKDVSQLNAVDNKQAAASLTFLRQIRLE
jgi:hypothetical protein